MASTKPNRKLKARIMEGDIPEWLRKHPRRSYIQAYVLSVPLSLLPSDLHALRVLAYRAACLSEMTGEPRVLDHTIPLNHPRVCGLTVPWNLTIKTAKANASKSNHVHLDDQLELFPS